MNHQQRTVSIEKKIFSLAGVTAFCFAIVWISPITVLSGMVSLEHSYFSLQFERHFWQYLFAFVAVIILSRGHLWSYGINSQNLKTSMVWLSWLYVVTIGVTFGMMMVGKEMLPMDASNLPQTPHQTIAALLVFWMSSPVANQILFFSFGQTILLKQWGDSIKIAGIPLVIVFSAIIFTFFGTTSLFSVGPFSPVFTFVLGLFCGTVYWKTNSLIAPMLGQAFYFGFPFFIHLLRSAVLQ